MQITNVIVVQTRRNQIPNHSDCLRGESEWKQVYKWKWSENFPCQKVRQECNAKAGPRNKEWTEKSREKKNDTVQKKCMLGGTMDEKKGAYEAIS